MEEKEKIGRVYDDRALQRLISGRVGMHSGKSARTYHCNVKGVQAGNKGGHASIDYLARENDFHDRRDLEYLSGDAKSMKSAVSAIDAGVRIRNGRTAEKVMMTIVTELPSDSTSETRRFAADALVQRWRDRGHEAIAAVHCDDETQPHIHLAITSRPVKQTDTGWIVDRTPGRVALRGGKRALIEERKAIASIINNTCKQNVQFFAGRDCLMDQPGITGRKPKHRIPQQDWHVDKVRDNAPLVITHIRERKQEERAEAKSRGAERCKINEMRRIEKIEKLDAVPREEYDRTLHTDMKRMKDLHEEYVSDLFNELYKAKKANAGQRKLIESMASENGISLPPNWTEFDAGKIIQQLKIAKKGEREQAQSSINSLPQCNGMLRLNIIPGASLEENAARKKAFGPVGTIAGLKWNSHPKVLAWELPANHPKAQEAIAHFGLKPEPPLPVPTAPVVPVKPQPARQLPPLQPLPPRQQATPVPPPQIVGKPIWLHPDSKPDYRAATVERLNGMDDASLSAARQATQDAMKQDFGARQAYALECLQGGLGQIEATMRGRGLLAPAPASPPPRSRNGGRGE